MKTPMKSSRKDLPDIQNVKDGRGKYIERVGIDNVILPLSINRKSPDDLPTTVQANVSMYVSVEHDLKGANMSRFLECLMSYKNMVLTSEHMKVMLDDMLQRLESKDGYIKVSFKYFI